MAKSMKLGGGGRFAKLKGELGRKGIRNPGALAASIGRKKYGAKRMGQMAAKGRSRSTRATGRLADHIRHVGDEGAFRGPSK